MEKKTAALIYARISCEKQLSNLSITTQKKACLEYCQKNGIPVKKVFVELAESARTANRPVFQQMLQYCESNKREIGFVVVYSLNRFARQNSDHHFVRAMLKRWDITLRSVTESMIDDSNEGKLLEGIIASFCQYDNDVRAARTKAGLIEALKGKGRWCFPAPIGYNSTKSKELPSLVHNPDQGPLVQQAFQMIAEHHTLIDSYNLMINKGMRTRRGYRPTLTQFHNMLNNPIYCGLITVHSLGIENRPGDFEPIISQDLFGKVQLALEQRHMPIKNLPKPAPQFPLRQFMRCNTCGVPLTGSSPRSKTNRYYSYYHCRNPKCRAIIVPIKKLDDMFKGILASLPVDSKSFKKFREIVQDAAAEHESQKEGIIKKLEAEIAQLNERKSVYAEACFIKKEMSKDVFNEQQARIDKDIKRLKAQILECDTDSINVAKTLDFAEPFWGNLLELWETSDIQEKRRIQSYLFPEGLKFDGEKVGTPFQTAKTFIDETLKIKKGGCPPSRSHLVARTGLEPVLPT